ncbi:hypothetical protein EON63_09875 [archaeon]|nr:MAG: hypothetical protein EON63_09875 [archaeon]
MLQRDVYYSLKHMFKQPHDCSCAIADLGRLLRMRRRR